MGIKKEKVFIPKAIGMTKTQIKDAIGEDWFIMLAWGDEESTKHEGVMSLGDLNLTDAFCQEYVDMVQKILEDDIDEEDRGTEEYDNLSNIMGGYPALIKQIKKLSI